MLFIAEFRKVTQRLYGLSKTRQTSNAACIDNHKKVKILEKNKSVFYLKKVFLFLPQNIMA